MDTFCWHGVEALGLDGVRNCDSRTSIRAGIHGLSAAAKPFLEAVLFTHERGHVPWDAENLLYYNVGEGCFTRLAREGVSFERANRPCPDREPTCRYHHTYALRDQLSPRTWRVTRPIAHWSFVSLGKRRDFKIERVWWAFACHPDAVVLDAPGSYGGLFGLEIELVGPRCDVNLTGKLKVLFDACTAAFHSFPASDGLVVDRLSHRLRTHHGIEVDPRALRAHLGDVSRGVLGPAGIRVHGQHVAWAPQDHRCVHGKLTRLGDGAASPEWAISGRLYAVEPIAVP